MAVVPMAPDTNHSWIVTDEFRRLHRAFTCGIGVMALIAWATALWAASKAPWVDDLYHLINPGARPPGPESTAMYLFWYPVILAFLFMTNLFAPDTILTAAPKTKNGQLATLLTGSSVALIFLSFSVFRAIAASSVISS
jgi:hypothetical protein